MLPLGLAATQDSAVSAVIRPRSIRPSSNLPVCLFLLPARDQYRNVSAAQHSSLSVCLLIALLFVVTRTSLGLRLSFCISPHSFFFPPALFSQYNSVNMKNKTAEEVYVEMLKPAETVTLKVQHRPDDFSLLKDAAGDGFYIRYVHNKISCFVSAVKRQKRPLIPNLGLQPQ